MNSLSQASFTEREMLCVEYNSCSVHFSSMLVGWLVGGLDDRLVGWSKVQADVRHATQIPQKWTVAIVRVHKSENVCLSCPLYTAPCRSTTKPT